MQRNLVLFAAAVAAALALAANASPNSRVTSTFAGGTEDWQVRGPAIGPIWEPGGGNPGGCISGSGSGMGGDWYFVAPAKFLGNRAGDYGKLLAFDLRTDSAARAGKEDVLLYGGGLILAFDTDSVAMPVWSRQGVPLIETAGWQKRVGPMRMPVTRAEFRAVLADLTAVEIRGGASTGQAYLDNVALDAPYWAKAESLPAASLLLTVLAGAVLLVARRRIKRA